MTDKDNTMQTHIEEMTRSFSDIWQKNTAMMTEVLNQSHQMVTKNMDPMNVGPAFANAAKVMASGVDATGGHRSDERQCIR